MLDGKLLLQQFTSILFWLLDIFIYNLQKVLANCFVIEDVHTVCIKEFWPRG